MNGGGGCDDKGDGDGGCSINLSRMYPLCKTELHRETEKWVGFLLTDTERDTELLVALQIFSKFSKLPLMYLGTLQVTEAVSTAA